MGDQKITAPLVTVIREGHEPLTVQTDNRDMLGWDKTRIPHKWPPMQEAPSLWLTFIAWHAARRTGAIPSDLKYEAWEREVIDTQVDTDDENPEVGAPFPEGDALPSDR